MRFLRLLNPFRHLRIERELDAMRKQRAGDKRAITSLVASIRRQAPAGSETNHLSMIVLLDGRVHALEVAAGVAWNYLRTGRPEAAHDVLAAILDAAPVDQREVG